jgi:hypothetical protein
VSLLVIAAREKSSVRANSRPGEVASTRSIAAMLAFPKSLVSLPEA